MLSSASLAEEGVEGVVATSDGLVTGHLAIRLDSVLKAVQLPAGVTDLGSGLSDVYGDTFTLSKRKPISVTYGIHGNCRGYMTYHYYCSEFNEIE